MLNSNSNKNIKSKKALSLLLAASIAAGGLSFSAVESYGYHTSLLGIESIKATNSSANPYNVLEIVPDLSSTSIGYYLSEGHELIDWQTILSVQTSEAERREYISNLSYALAAEGIASTDKATPLKINAYTEYKPWEAGAFDEGVFEIKQTHGGDPVFSSENAPDKFEAVDLGSGSYEESSGYQEATGKPEAEYYLNPIYLEKVDAPLADGTHYYYPADGFVKYDFKVPGAITGMFGKTFYQLDDEGNYQLFGTMIEGGDLYINSGEDYYVYTLNPDNKDFPSTTYSEETPYLATKTQYVEAAGTEYEPHFELVERSYTYVGEGNGDYAYDQHKTADGTVSIKYDTVFVPNMFESNNWFARYVMDVENPETKPFITEHTVATPNTLTVDMINQADLIVISNGYTTENIVNKPVTGKADVKIYNTVSSSMTDEVQAALSAATVPVADSDGVIVPIIYTKEDMDGGFIKTDAEFLIEALETYVKANAPTLFDEDGDSDEGYVYKHIFAFGELETAAGNDIEQFITTVFNGQLDDELYTEANSPFKSVIDEINEENLLRQIAGTEELPSIVSLATNTRAIINSVDTRITVMKEKLNVLEIQPIRNPKDDKIDDQEISEIKLAQWMNGSGFTEDMINVETMAITEFVSNIEEISEEYDMIYIGASTEGFNLLDGHPNYNDNSMDGMYYTNVGDRYTMGGIVSAGLINSEFDSSRLVDGYYPVNSVLETRIPGRDLTYSKLEDLVEFVASGFPVIISDTLVNTEIRYTEEPIERSLDFKIAGAMVDTATSDLPTADGDKVLLIESMLVDGAGVNQYGIYTNAVYDWKYLLGSDQKDLADVTDMIANANTGIPTISFEWIEDVMDASGVDKITFKNELSYHNVISEVEEYVGFTNWISVTREGDVFEIISESESSIPTVNIVNPGVVDRVAITGINEKHLDNSSNMDLFIETVRTADNVFAVSDVYHNGLELAKYANLSKPTLSVSSAPAEYTNLDSLVSNGVLEYKFTISNPTDPSPETTNYRIDLLIEQNSDGRFDTNTELLGDLSVTEVATGSSVDANNLKIGTEYKLSKALPLNLSGAIHWKLVATMEGNEKSHDSIDGITYRQSSGITNINVLQILPENKGIAYNSLANVSSFKSMFADLEAKGLYDIDVTTIHVTTLNNMKSNEEIAASGSGGESVEQYLDKFNMIIAGFGDSFGGAQTATSGGFDLESAMAISGYIDTGKSVLVTHDLASMRNLPDKVYPKTSGGTFRSTPYMGFYYNHLLRDKTGLDVYGVTNYDYGLSDYNIFRKDDIIKTGNNYVANEYIGATSVDDTGKSAIDKLVEEGYSIAYKPGSDRTEFVKETHGYSTHSIIISSTEPLNATADTDYEKGKNHETNRITQVNDGLITSYPYNINLEGFGGDGEYMSIASTHQQYYQLNLNNEEIVVWYALGDNGNDRYLNHYNDGGNTYYIYSAGNVTYSGAGHSDAADFTNDEAKLFVNTIIAAYRVGTEGNSIRFDDGSGNAVPPKFIPIVESSEGFSGQIYENKTGSAIEIPFRVTEDNLGTGKTTTVTLLVSENNASYDLELEQSLLSVHQVVNGVKVPLAAGTNLRTGVQYYLYLPEEALDMLYNSAGNKISLMLELTTTFRNPDGSTETVVTPSSGSLNVYEMALHSLV